MIDVAIIGGGPAGITAGLYASRGGLSNVVMFEYGMPGGQITSSSEIENYPGVSEVVSGIDFMQNWLPQAQRFGLKHEMQEIVNIKKEDNIFVLTDSSNKTVHAKTVIVATGSVPKKAGFEGESEFFGRGVSVCATCDGFFYRNKEVAVIGGGDTALEEAHYLAKFCSKVYIIHRRDSFKAAPSTVQRVMHDDKIELITNTKVISAFGDASGLNGLKLESSDGTTRELHVPGAFVFVGRDVNNKILQDEAGKSICSLLDNGEVVVDLKMRTNVAGLYAAGDCRSYAPRQVVCAAGDGATAAINAIEYISNM